MIYEEDEKLSKNFSLDEFSVSRDFPEIAKKIVITKYLKQNITNLVINVLQPIRTEINERIEVISGIRNKALNKAIHGSNTSDHMEGSASDIISESILKNPKEIAYKIWNMNLPIRQIIYYPNDNFIHLSINIDSKPFKHELLKSDNGKTYIKEG